MSRSDGPQLVTARAQLRERFEAQQAALDDYIGCHRKVAKLEASLAELVGRQTAALGRLAELTDAAIAAELTGCSLHSAREALTAHRATGNRRRDTAAVAGSSSEVTRVDGDGDGG